MPGPCAGPVRRRLRQRRVLVVEDEPLVAMLIEDELREAGAEVLGPAGDPEAALRTAGQAPPGRIELAALDMNLRGRTSGPVAAAPARRGIPFVVATGSAAERLAEVPGAPVFCKAFDRVHLVGMLQELLPRAMSANDAA